MATTLTSVLRIPARAGKWSDCRIIPITCPCRIPCHFQDCTELHSRLSSWAMKAGTTGFIDIHTSYYTTVYGVVVVLLQYYYSIIIIKYIL